MTAEEFRTRLAALGLSQNGFAKLLTSLGHPSKDIARTVRRWAQEPGPPGEVAVILKLLDEAKRLNEDDDEFYDGFGL